MKESNENKLATTSENSPMLLIQKAVEAGTGIEQMERLMDLQERWEKKEAEKAFHQAKSSFQSEKPVIVKTNKVDYSSKAGGRVKYNYVPLSKIQKAVDPILAKYGLSYRFEQSGEGGKIKITCILSHIKGHSESTYLEAGADNSGSKNSIQAIGSTVSYLKRYTLENALGLSADEDDDGASVPDLADAKQFGQFKELTQLLIIKSDEMEPKVKSRVEHILMSEEKASYLKAIKTLKEL